MISTSFLVGVSDSGVDSEAILQQFLHYPAGQVATSTDNQDWG